MTPETRILLIGATGYIGGSILNELLNNKDSPRYVITVLVRQEAQAAKLKEASINALLFKGLDDVEAIKKSAEDNDIIIAAASARHPECAKACIAGLSERARKRGTATHYIHTSGTSMISDWPVTGERVDESFHSDMKEDIYELEKNHPEKYSAVRKVDQVVAEAGLSEGVRTYIVPPPLIFGKGSGMFNTVSGQVDMIAELSFKHKQAVVIGDGKGVWSRVHIRDLSKLYFLLVSAILDPLASIPYGKTGYYFAENGYQTWLDISEKIGELGKARSAFETEDVKSIGLQEPADLFFNGSAREAESVLASNSRTIADRAKQILHWRPVYLYEEFRMYIEDTVDAEVAKMLTT